MLKILLSFMLFFLLNANAQDTKKYSQEEITQMLAPIALYPDALLSQILMASTYDKQLQEAIAYSKSNPDEKGDDAVKKVQDKGWDASVSSLVAFPQVLEMLGKKPEWSKDLGNAFLEQPDNMMDTIQTLRKKAEDEGNLKSSTEQVVKTEDQNSTEAIIIAPATQTVYVPVYNPTYVYGSWMYPAYPPYYYYPPHYNPVSGFVFGFTVGIIISNSMWGGFGWHNHSVNINVNRYNKINVNKISGNKNSVNWKNHTQRSNAKNKLSSRDLQRQKASKTMKKNGINPTKERQKLSGANGEKMRQNLKSDKYKTKSSAFSGVSKPKRAKLEASRGSSSRQHKNFSGGGFSGHSNFGGGQKGGFSGGLRGRR